jgi:hypothetical protein
LDADDLETNEEWREKVDALAAKIDELTETREATAATLKRLETQLTALTAKNSDLSAKDQRQLATLQQELADLKATLAAQAATPPNLPPVQSPPDDAAGNPVVKTAQNPPPENPNATPANVKPPAKARVRVF